MPVPNLPRSLLQLGQLVDPVHVLRDHLLQPWHVLLDALEITFVLCIFQHAHERLAINVG